MKVKMYDFDCILCFDLNLLSSQIDNPECLVKVADFKGFSFSRITK